MGRARGLRPSNRRPADAWHKSMTNGANVNTPCSSKSCRRGIRRRRKSASCRTFLFTHNTSSLYETFAAEEAFALAQRFEFYYTPKKASWLNMQEIEFSAIARQCLRRRIATKAELEREVLAIVKERANKAIKIEWQFSIESARAKLNRHYEQVHAENVQYKRT